jgi:hypothetical protein
MSRLACILSDVWDPTVWHYNDFQLADMYRVQGAQGKQALERVVGHHRQGVRELWRLQGPNILSPVNEFRLPPSATRSQLHVVFVRERAVR